MKLRNKKTGEVFNFSIKAEQDYTASYLRLRTGSGGWEDGLLYGTIGELQEEWEDATDNNVGTLPLIKDEKMRKAVRAWADGNNIESVHYDAFWRGFRRENSSITVWEELPLEDNKVYTIAELCGEEEAPEPLEPTFVDLDEQIKDKEE